MSVSYASYEQFTQVYSIKGVSEADISSYWLFHGALRTNESLGGFFETPFGSDNHTARDLSIHFAYLGIESRLRTSQPTEIKIKGELNQRLTDIRCGNTPMILDDGASIYADTAKVDAWSSTENYNPTFNMLPAIDQRIDPDLLEDEYTQVFG